MINELKWDYTPSEAIKEQNQLRDRVSLEDDFGEIKYVGGVDMSIGRGWSEGWCGLVVLTYPDLVVVEEEVFKGPVVFPYVPGLLAYRELPLFFQAYSRLRTIPDLLFFDGQGYAHPRRFGIACHAGIILDKPTIGCAKSRLMGDFTEPKRDAGSISQLLDGDERIGDVIRARAGIKPIFVSPGHKVSFDSAVALTLSCVRGHRIPEPTRLAHKLITGKGG